MVAKKYFMLVAFALLFCIATAPVNAVIVCNTTVGNWTENDDYGAVDWIDVATSWDGNHLVAMEYGGYPYTSADGGYTWTQNINTSGYWTSVSSSSDGKKLVAIYPGYDIFTSNNFGVTWTDRVDAGVRDWIGVSSSSDGKKIIAITVNEEVVVSSDSGVTWTDYGSGAGFTNTAFIDSSGDGTKVLVAIYGGDLHLSNDSGETFTDLVDIGMWNDWIGVAISSDGEKLMAATYDGYVFTSSDGGETWNNDTYYEEWINCTAYNNNSTACEENGCTWVCLGFPCRRPFCTSNQYLVGAAMSGDGSTMGVYQSLGYLYVSRDDGATWVEQTVPGSRGWGSMDFSYNGSFIIAADYFDTGGHIWMYRDEITCSDVVLPASIDLPALIIFVLILFLIALIWVSTPIYLVVCGFVYVSAGAFLAASSSAFVGVVVAVIGLSLFVGAFLKR